MELSTKKKRIDFIDLAKGICIILVILTHCGVNFPIPGFGMMRMPLYFILSGLFFKDYGGFLQHTLKKFNKILIPFLFFYCVSYIPFYAFEYFKPGLIRTDASGILDLFYNRQFFNGPIWFLLTLFWTNILFCIISLNIKNEYFKGLAVLLLGFFGILLGINEIFIPLFIDVALTALPFFYFGYLLTKTQILYPNKFDKYNIIFIIIFYGLTYAITIFFKNSYFAFHYNGIRGNVIASFVGSISCVMAVLMLCKMIKKLPIISFCGRYSIILLCLHHLIYRPLQLVIKSDSFPGSNYVIAILTILICMACIPLCKKFMPWFVAQKDLIVPKQSTPIEAKTA